MLPERSTTDSIATPSVEISERTVPFLGRARAIINKVRQIILAAKSTGLSLRRHEMGQLRMFSRLGNRIAAERFLRRSIYARIGNIRSNNNAHGECNCIYAAPASTVSSVFTRSVISILLWSDLVFSMKILTRSNVR